MKELGLREILSGPTYRTEYATAKAENTCIRCGGYAVKFRDTSSKLEYMVPALCQRCQEQCFSLAENRVRNVAVSKEFEKVESILNQQQRGI